MVKVKVISRIDAEHLPETKLDIQKQQRNLDPEAHPFEKAREYTRALNATKLDRVFAKPFICAFDGHLDTVWRLATVPTRLTTVFSGSCDGELRAWNLTSRELSWRVKAHEGFVRGISATNSGERILTCGDDKTIRIWDLNANRSKSRSIAGYGKGDYKPVAELISKNRLTELSCSWEEDSHVFATAGAQVDLWSQQRSKPIHSFSWTAETIRGVEFCPVETNVLCSWSSDRTIVIYDTRVKLPTNSITMKNVANCVAWNPREAFTLTIGSADYNAYTFDIRKFNKAQKVHEGHVQDVQSISYCPTGKEFVTGGYDCTVRIWKTYSGQSRAVYHTKRMQRVYSVAFTADSRFVISGSDDTNVRVWKSNASKPLDKLKPPEKRKLEYYDKLKKRYGHLPEIRRIAKHQHLPRWIKGKKEQLRQSKIARKKKENNIVKHSKPGSVPFIEEKRKAVIRTKHGK